MDSTEILSGLGIETDDPEAHELAPVWSVLLEWVSKGADNQTACRLARVHTRTFSRWLQRGQGYTKPDGTAVAPSEPWVQFVAAYNEARASVVADAWAALAAAARSGDVQAASKILERRDAQKTAVERSAMARAQLNGQRIRNRRERVEVEIAKAKLAGTLPAEKHELTHAGDPLDALARAVARLAPPGDEGSGASGSDSGAA